MHFSTLISESSELSFVIRYKRIWDKWVPCLSRKLLFYKYICFMLISLLKLHSLDLFSSFLSKFIYNVWASQMALVVKESACQSRRCKRCEFNSWVGTSPGGRGMANHSSIPIRKIPWTEDPERL